MDQSARRLNESLRGVSLRFLIWNLDSKWSGIDMLILYALICSLDHWFYSSQVARITPERSPSNELRPLHVPHALMGNPVFRFGRAVSLYESVAFFQIAGRSGGGDVLSRGTSGTTLHKYSFHQEVCLIPTSNTRDAPPILGSTRSNSAYQY